MGTERDRDRANHRERGRIILPSLLNVQQCAYSVLSTSTLAPILVFVRGALRLSKWLCIYLVNYTRTPICFGGRSKPPRASPHCHLMNCHLMFPQYQLGNTSAVRQRPGSIPICDLNSIDIYRNVKHSDLLFASIMIFDWSLLRRSSLVPLVLPGLTCMSFPLWFLCVPLDSSCEPLMSLTTYAEMPLVSMNQRLFSDVRVHCSSQRKEPLEREGQEQKAEARHDSPLQSFTLFS